MSKLSKLEKKAERKLEIIKLKRKRRIQKIQDRALEVKYTSGLAARQWDELIAKLNKQKDQAEIKERTLKRDW